jgi:hypothetical protein
VPVGLPQVKYYVVHGGQPSDHFPDVVAGEEVLGYYP